MGLLDLCGKKLERFGRDELVGCVARVDRAVADRQFSHRLALGQVEAVQVDPENIRAAGGREKLAAVLRSPNFLAISGADYFLKYAR